MSASSRIGGPLPIAFSINSIAPAVLSNMTADGELNISPITPRDIVFSCCVCLDTLSDVYNDLDHPAGLHHEPSQPKGRIIKLYLTGCAHVVCAKHLDGGGQY